MINYDENALICDLAETYNIYDYRSLPVTTVATLAAGLRDESRIMQKANGADASMNTILLAIIADRVATLMNGKDDMPLTNSLIETNSKRSSNVRTFKTGSDFEEMWQKINGEK